MYAVDVNEVRQRFGTTDALTGVNLQVAEGEVLGLLGPNGAGKTTLVRVLATLLEPTTGSARIFGHDVVSNAEVVRRMIGLTGQYAAVDELLSGRENLRMFGELFHLRRREARARADELLARFDLEDAADRPARTYSGGMRRRLDLASSLLIRPRLLFLDEPTTGLDPRSRNGIWDITRELVADGTTLLLTTQYLEEADQLADRIAVIDHGHIIAEGTGDELKDQAGGQVIDVVLTDREARDRASTLLGSQTTVLDERTVQIPVAADVALGEVARVATRLGDAGLMVRDLGLRRPTLDDVFLQLTERRAADPVSAESSLPSAPVARSRSSRGSGPSASRVAVGAPTPQADADLPISRSADADTPTPRSADPEAPASPSAVPDTPTSRSADASPDGAPEVTR